ncbi:hypothetical protein F66182_10419 [Fusarium sp. NRRL 66182]|nr:hypothetical protein F66182_10419 [Fusarium sp. NRRL 66182]
MAVEASLELERFHPSKEVSEPNPQCRSESTQEQGSTGSEKIRHQQGREYGAEKRLDRPKNLPRSIAANLVRWFCTAIFVVAIYLVLLHYSRKEIISTAKKREFNALIIGLSLGLGMSITVSLEAMAVEIRWWILSRRNWPDSEAELIFKAKDLTSIVQLAWVSRSRWIRSYAVVFILLNLVSQVALAMLGLVYSTSTAESSAILIPGNVTVPDFSDLDTNRVLASKSQGLSALRYGTIALAWLWGGMDLTPRPGTLWDNNDPLIFCGTGSCKYVFQESAVRPKKYDLIVSTNRSVEVTGRCHSWKVARGGAGNQSTITIDDEARTEVNMMAINGVNQTTFMFNATADQGETWSEITAFEASSTNPWFYRCNISFGPVINSKRKEHQIGPNVTSLATSAIALQGYGASSLATESSDQQFQSYPAESTYGEPLGGRTDDMGTLISAFSTGVVAVAAQVANNLVVPGLQPQNGVVLDISKWVYIHLILGLTLGVQLFLGV